MQGYYQVAWLLTIVSWVAVPFINHFLTNLRDRRSEYNNHLNDLDRLFNDMNSVAKDYFSNESWSEECFYELLSYNERMKILLRRLQQIDKKYCYPERLIIEIRQITTDDEYRDRYGIHGMRALIATQTRIFDAAPKKVRWF